MSRTRPTVVATLLLILGLLSNVMAADEIGIFFDSDGISTEAATSAPNELVTAYLVILDPSAVDPITGWECRISWFTDGPDLVPVQWNLRGNGTNYDAAPNFLVGVDTPLPVDTPVVLMDFLVLVPSVDDPAVLFVRAYSIPSIVEPPGSDYRLQRPIYGSGAHGDLTPLVQTSGCESLPVAEINGPAAEPSIELTVPPVAVLPFATVDYTQFPVTNTGDSPVSSLMAIWETADVLLRIDDGGWFAGPLWLHVDPGATAMVGVRVLNDGLFPLTCSISGCGSILAETQVTRSGMVFLVEPEVLDLGTVEPGTYAYADFELINRTMHPLSLDLGESCPLWFVQPISLSVPPFASATATVGLSANEPGDTSCDIEINWSDGAFQQDVVHCVAFVGDPIGVIAGDVTGRPQILSSFPNPCNPRTTIAFELPTSQRMTLRVFDVRGRVVRVLIDGVRGPGRHETVWDGRTAGGVVAASGVYFLRLETAGWTDTHRIVLAR